MEGSSLLEALTSENFDLEKCKYFNEMIYVLCCHMNISRTL